MSSNVEFFGYTDEHWVLAFKLPEEIYKYYQERVEESTDNTITDPDNIFINRIICGLTHSEHSTLLKNRIGDNDLRAELQSLRVRHTKENDIDLIQSNKGLFSFVIMMSNSTDKFSFVYPYTDTRSRAPSITVETHDVSIRAGYCYFFPNYLQYMGYYNTKNTMILGNVA